MKLIVGLGNPGKEYVTTRHNAGFLMLDTIEKWMRCADAFSFNIKRKRTTVAFSSFSFSCERGREEVMCLRPLTYMNRSGEVLSSFLREAGHDVDIQKDLLILHDDVDIPFGTVRVAHARSSAGHNGIQSIIDNLKTSSFTRFRIGIRSHRLSGRVETFVLKNFSKEEQTHLQTIGEQMPHLIEQWIVKGYAPIRGDHVIDI